MAPHTARKPMSRKALAAVHGPVTPPAHHDADYAERVRVNTTLRMFEDANPQPLPTINDRRTGAVLAVVVDTDRHCTCGAPATNTMTLHGETYPCCAPCGRVAAMLRHPAGRAS